MSAVDGRAELLALEALVDRADEAQTSDATVSELLDDELRRRGGPGWGIDERGLGMVVGEVHHRLQKCSDRACVRNSRRFKSSSKHAVTSVCLPRATSKNIAVDALWHTIIPSPAPPCD